MSSEYSEHILHTYSTQLGVASQENIIADIVSQLLMTHAYCYVCRMSSWEYGDEYYIQLLFKDYLSSRRGVNRKEKSTWVVT